MECGSESVEISGFCELCVTEWFCQFFFSRRLNSKNMRYVLALMVWMWAQAGVAQEAASASADTTVYISVDEPPRFPACEDLDTTAEAKTRCAEEMLLRFMAQNIVYPFEARAQGIEGTVVLSFIVEPDGRLTHVKLEKDIGGGCGAEALRIVNAMIESDLRWVPGKLDGKPVRVRYTLPVRFRLEDPPEFVMIGADTVYVVFDDTLQFEGGSEALAAFFAERLKYPEAWIDSCLAGKMDLKLLVPPEGWVRVIDIQDYSGLGLAFWWEAIVAASETTGKWKPATRNGRPVPAAYDISVTFLPPGEGCAEVRANFAKAEQLIAEGSALFNEGKKEEGLARINEAVALFPEDAEYRYVRGQALMNMDRKEEACEDFKAVLRHVQNPLVAQLVPLLCKPEGQE